MFLPAPQCAWQFADHNYNNLLQFKRANSNDRRSRRVLLCFYSAIFKLTSAKFQTFAYSLRTVNSNYMKI